MKTAGELQPGGNVGAWEVNRVVSIHHQYRSESLDACCYRRLQRRPVRLSQISDCEAPKSACGLGPNTIKAINAVQDQDQLLQNIAEIRRKYYKMLVDNDASQVVFFEGLAWPC